MSRFVELDLTFRLSCVPLPYSFREARRRGTSRKLRRENAGPVGIASYREYQGGPPRTGRRRTVTHHANDANAESTRSTVGRDAGGLLPRLAPPRSPCHGVAQRRDRGATLQTGLSLGPRAAGSSLAPKQEPPPRSPLPRSPVLSLAYGSAWSSAGGPSHVRGYPTLELGPPAPSPLFLRQGKRCEAPRRTLFPADSVSLPCRCWRRQVLGAQSP